MNTKGVVPTLDESNIKELLNILLSVKKGDFSVRMPSDQIGLAGKIADTVNTIIESNAYMTEEFQKMSRMVGKEGKTTQRALVRNLQETGRLASIQ